MGGLPGKMSPVLKATLDIRVAGNAMSMLRTWPTVVSMSILAKRRISLSRGTVVTSGVLRMSSNPPSAAFIASKAVSASMLHSTRALWMVWPTSLTKLGCVRLRSPEVRISSLTAAFSVL